MLLAWGTLLPDLGHSFKTFLDPPLGLMVPRPPDRSQRPWAAPGHTAGAAPQPFLTICPVLGGFSVCVWLFEESGVQTIARRLYVP